jgi:hypothetical protein
LGGTLFLPVSMVLKQFVYVVANAAEEVKWPIKDEKSDAIKKVAK